jgi:hypothetical protein
MGCIGEKIAIGIDFYYEDISYVKVDEVIYLKPAAVDVNLVDSTGIILTDNTDTFREYYVGDTIGVYTGSAFAFYTVLEKFGSSMIRTDYAGSFLQLNVGDYIFNSTPFSGIRYAYNLIDSGNSFNSLIDGEYQELIIDGKDCSDVSSDSMEFTGLLSYQIGSATIVGGGGVGGGNVTGQFTQQSFTITHNAVITPLFLTSQYNDLLAGTKPSYYEAAACLNYIAQIQLNRNLNNPNGLQTLTVPSTVSNTAWYNEKFNGGKTNYSISSVILTKGTETLTNGLEFDSDITVDILVNNTTDSPFSNGNTKYIFLFNYLPENETYYKNNGYNQTRNFVFDSKMNTLGTGFVNGDNYGGGMQVIKRLTSTYISTSQMKVTATINVGATAKAIIQQGDYYRYLFSVITENHSLSAVNSDKVNLIASVGEFYVQKTNTDYIINDGIKFLPHVTETVSEGVTGTDLDSFPVDDIVSVLPFSVDYSDAVTGVVGSYAYNAVTNLIGTNNALILVDTTNNKTIGVADYATSNSNTLNILMNSINTNTALGSIFGGAPAFDNSEGYTAQRSGDYMYIFAPTKGVAYNGIAYTLTRTDTSASSSSLFGGVDEVLPTITNQGSKIIKIRSKFVLKDGADVETDIILEDFAVSTSNYPIVGGMAQNINIAQDRVYKIVDSIRRVITCTRDFTSDTTYEKFFEYSYPFMIRWEYWKQYLITTPPSGIFDSTETYDGLNYQWQRFTDVADWHLWYQVIFTIEQNGEKFEQTIETELQDIKEFEANPEYVGNSIKSYDTVTLAELTYSGTKYIKGYEDVKIVATFIKTSGYLPLSGEYNIVIWIHVFEEGGDSSITQIGSVYENDSQSLLKSTDTSNKVVLNKTGGTYTGTCLVDYTKIPNKSKFTVYARMYETYPANTKQFMDGDVFQFMDGTYYQFM